MTAINQALEIYIIFLNKMSVHEGYKETVLFTATVSELLVGSNIMERKLYGFRASFLL